MKNLLKAITLVMLFSLSSCIKDDGNNAEPQDYDYFPQIVGITRIYQVDSIYWDSFSGIHDTVSYEIKEVISSFFTDNQGRTTSRIERYRKDPGGSWGIIKVWASNKTNNTYEQTEDNIRYFKLAIPAKENATWNGNTYNTLDDQEYKSTNVHEPDTINSLSFDHTVTVNQINDDNLVYTKYGEERYAAYIGMYYRDKTDIEKNIVTGETLSGYIYTEKLISYIAP
jgi:hypothetical protein